MVVDVFSVFNIIFLCFVFEESIIKVIGKMGKKFDKVKLDKLLIVKLG